MTKVISLELAKRLAPYLENIETEIYWVTSISNPKWSTITTMPEEKVTDVIFYKTLSFSKSIEFICTHWSRLWIIMYEYPKQKWVWKNIINPYDVIKFFSEMKNIEEMLTYLLDNNLLWQKN